MQKFHELESVAAVINEINIDTDAIIPKQFLKTIERTGLGKFLFYDKRYDELNNIKTDFILNKVPWSSSKILIAGNNFGCGSSREHAPWALLDFGIKCVIAPSFADIFFNNSIKNGLLPLTLSKPSIEDLCAHALEKKLIKISLLDKKIFYNKLSLDFDIASNVRERLLNGYDDIELTLQKKDMIELYEKKNFSESSWRTIDNERKS
jgi:3-isopropylmalate/(R)-2-methylmalate dehydratase small subunit|tara:strand:+ start:246 stop:866 length:621 start_codon:yes stop_codon:yes gene_type:complete